MIRWMLVTVGAFVACFFYVPQRCIAAPALWLVQTPTSKVYLFGTVHVLNDTVNWRSAELEAAIAQSQDLYLEIANANDTREGMSAMMKLGVDRDHPLSSILPKADVALLDRQARTYGLPGETMFEPFRPWFAYLMLASLSAGHSTSGSGGSGGVDLQLRSQFAGAGKPIRGFETFENQAHIFSNLPQATQIAMLESSLRASQTAGTDFDSIVRAWQSGDDDNLARPVKLDALKKSPLYAPLIGARNAAWATVLAQRLTEPGTSFVAVGAAHLLGPDGVPALLRQKGYSVTRVHIADASPLPVSSSSPLPSPAVSATPAATASPAPPASITAPVGWTKRTPSAKGTTFIVDEMWTPAVGPGALVSAHLAASSAAIPDLDSADVFLHQGLVVAAGSASAVQPSKHVKLCGGTQDGLYTVVTVGAVKEDLAIAMTGHIYMAQYARPKTLQDDPAALKALYTLCAPK